MHRTGFHPDDAVEALRRLRDEPHVRLTGPMTHLACADDPAEDDFTAEQLAGFHRVIDEAARAGISCDFQCHAAATSGAIRVVDGRFDMVRLGLGLYGIHPSEASEALLPLDPAVSLVSRIVHCFPLREGDRVGTGARTGPRPGAGARDGPDRLPRRDLPLDQERHRLHRRRAVPHRRGRLDGLHGG